MSIHPARQGRGRVLSRILCNQQIVSDRSAASGGFGDLGDLLQCHGFKQKVLLLFVLAFGAV
jgi:hypothetical protein